MKARHRFLPLLAMTSSLATAATHQYWNVGSTGGDGIWGIGPGDKNWNLTPGAATGNTTWADPTDNIAVFQDAIGGTVTVFDPVQTNGLSQAGANYTLDAGVITLVSDTASTGPFVNVQTGTFTVNSVLAGTSGLVKTGTGNLLLTAANPFTGPTVINAGTLTLNGSLSSTSVGIASGAILLDKSSGLDASTALTNAGTLLINAPDTVATYTQNGSGVLGGSNSLTTTGGATLNGGTVSTRLWGDITSTGNVLITGPTGGGYLAVTGGLLTLNGSAAARVVTIAANAGLAVGADLLDSRAALTNAGTLSVTGRNYIKTYQQAVGGVLAGTGEFTTGDSTLQGGTISGILSGATITTTGDVLVSGSIDGRILSVSSGTLTLTGAATTSVKLNIAPVGTLVDVNAGLDSTTDLTNAGVLIIDSADTIKFYTQSAGSLLTGPGVLTASSIVLQGGTVAGNLSGSITTKSATEGDVLVSGTIGGGSLDVTGRTLTLSGISSNSRIRIYGQGTLVDVNGGLDSAAVVTNEEGTMNVGATEAVATYTQNSKGSLTGTGTLTATGGALLSGGTVAGKLMGNITSTGNVVVSGLIGGGSLDITGGTLSLTGTSTHTNINIASGATLAIRAIHAFPQLLTTSGAGVGTWQGDLSNPTTVAPGGVGATGTLAVTGNLTNAPGGTLKLDLGAGGHDLVAVGGTATFGGTLDLNQLSPIAPFVPVQLVAAGSYSGNFTTLTENLDGTAWFDPTNGRVTTLALPSASSDSTLYGTSANETAVWISLYDDVIDPAATNVTDAPGGGYAISSGIADVGNPDLLNALAASFVAGGLNGAVLDRLSPEVYGGFQDYAIQATRSHQRAALDAPSLGFILAPSNPHTAGSKNAQIGPPAANPWEYFAAVDYFDTATDSSPNGADYDLSGYGFIAGARTTLSERVRLGGYVAADSGKLDGTLIDADAAGWSLGVFARALIDERTHTLVTGGLSYGSYSFDGARGSLIATGGGWSHASASFSNVDSDALELFLGISSLMHQGHGFRLMPAAGLRYVGGSMDGFAETSGAAGSPIALVVDRDSYHHALAELSLRAEADVTASLTLDGLLGVNVGLGSDDPAGLNARFATGSRSFRANAAGLDDDAVFLGLGANWRIRDNFALGLHWRADFREDTDMENTVGLSTSIRF